MTQRSRTFLRGRFEQGDIPTGTDYEDLIDSFLSLEASATETMAGTLALPTLRPGKIVKSTDSITATGTVQASAALVSADVIAASAEQLERAIILPALEPGRVQHIVNTGTTALAIFPPTGGNFVGSAANGGITIAADQGIAIFHVVSAFAFVRG